MPNLQQYQRDLIPTYEDKDPLKDFEEILGITKDIALDASKASVKSGFIQTAPVDALYHLGINANTPKPEIFTDDQYRDKLARNWDRWTLSGTVNQLVSEIKELGFPRVAVVPVWTLVAPNKYINTLGIDELNQQMVNSWGAFWVVIDQPHNYQVVNWGDPKWGFFQWGQVIGDLVKLLRMVSIIKQLKPAWTSCRGIVFIQGQQKVWDTFNWGQFNFGTTYGVYRIYENWEQV